MPAFSSSAVIYLPNTAQTTLDCNVTLAAAFTGSFTKNPGFSSMSFANISDLTITGLDHPPLHTADPTEIATVIDFYKNEIGIDLVVSMSDYISASIVADVDFYLLTSGGLDVHTTV